MKELLARLTETWGPPGREEAVAKVITAALQPLVDSIRRDPLGNVIGVRGPRGDSSGRRLLLAASMDSAGGLVTDIGSDGRLRFGLVGRRTAAALCGRQVRFAGGAVAVVAAEKVDPDLKAADCWLDLGVATAEAARLLVSEGEMFVPDGGLEALGEVWSGPHIEERAGCAVLLEVARRLGDCPHEVHFAFTVQGQLASPRGARTAAFAAEADLAVAVTATPAAPGKGATAKLGGGPVLRLREQQWVLRPAAQRLLTAAAEAAGLQWQAEARAEGASEAGPLGLASGGMPVAVLALPVRSVVGALGLAHPADLEGAAHWLATLATQPLSGT